MVINHVLSTNSLRKCMEISIEFVSGSIYLQEVLEGRAGQEVPKNKLDLLVTMQFNFIPSDSRVCISLASFQSRLYPDKLERCDVTKIQICPKSFQVFKLCSFPNIQGGKILARYTEQFCKPMHILSFALKNGCL